MNEDLNTYSFLFQARKCHHLEPNGDALGFQKYQRACHCIYALHVLIRFLLHLLAQCNSKRSLRLTINIT
jgi:hypothetical protein